MLFQKTSRSAYITTALLLLGQGIHAQNCTPSEMYGWATQSGGTTGGKDGNVVEVSTMADLKSQASKSGKLIIYVKGKLSGSFSVSSNKTIIGYPGAQVGGISMSGVSNIILRNLIVRGSKCASYDDCKSGSDAISLNNSHHVWLDHLDIADGQDGNLDITNKSDFVTVSYCKFSYTYDKQHAFSNLNGSADDATGDKGKLNVTFHHNWWADRILERQPRMRFGKFHVANNLYTSQKANYVAGVGIEARLLFEGNIIKSTAAVVQYFPGGKAENVISRNNNPSSASIDGTGFVPPYSMPLEEPTAALETVLQTCAGATLGNPDDVLTASLEQSLEVRSTVYPNPCHDQLIILAPKGSSYELLNTQGKILLEDVVTDAHIDMQGLPSGMYLLKLKQNHTATTIKVQKVD